MATTGCPSPDAEGKLNDFLEATEDQRGSGGGGPMGGGLSDQTGMQLFALSAVLAPALPLQFISTTEMTIAPDLSGATMNINLQPLQLMPGSTTEPRTPIGDPIVITDIAVDAMGLYTIELMQVMVTGMANPITGGDILADLIIEGAIQSEDLACGTVTGDLFQPITFDLVGSSFASVRIESTDPASLPTEVQVECPDEGGGSGSGGGSGGSGSGG